MGRADDVAQRAYLALKHRKIHERVDLIRQGNQIGIGKAGIALWKSGDTAPGARVLRRMAFAGYDVVWILTGRTGKRVHLEPRPDEPRGQIGRRMVEETVRIAGERKQSVKEAERVLGICHPTYRYWAAGERDPEAAALQTACRLGYDIYYILCGR